MAEPVAYPWSAMTAAQQLLLLHLERAEVLSRVGGGPLVAARLAFRLGEPELARALLARTGGLFDLEESQRLLNDPCPEALLVQAAQVLPGRVAMPAWTETEMEMYVRVLASLLVSDAPPDAARLGGGRPGWAGGLRRLSPCPEQQRWGAGLHLARELQGPLRWATASWGGRFGLQRQVNAAGLGQVEVVSLEYVMTALDAAWRWDLPELAQLLSGPLLIEGLETLAPDRLDTLTSLLADASRLFDWPVVALPGFEVPWPDAYPLLPLPQQSGTGGQDDPPAPVTRQVLVLPRQRPISLRQLATEVRGQPGRSLVVLYSRSSAARLAGMLPGSVLLSSSLSRLHLAERMSELAEQQAASPSLTVVATTLPSTAVGFFDQVSHISAPLPYLIEAAQLSRGTFRILDLLDVALPQLWTRQLQVTHALLGQGDALNDPELQRLYFDELRALERHQRAPYWLELRRNMQYASLASELNAQSEASVPVLIARDQASEQVIARYRREGWLPRQGLRHAAWLTASEARRAVQRGEAEDGGWALIWRGDYHPDYGLAWPYVQAAQSSE
ncbi:hypothetical protein [Deinococcus fonticola]|uniref:hypothetical protein n=1 Tax=Deinococcus fonticola TaxID=2528713 RepID=UPI001F0D1251|nr:hypothetical protein [Deinococcus fonticola]